MDEDITYITPLYQGYITVTHAADPDDDWGRDSTSTSYDVYGVTVARGHRDMAVFAPVKSGDTVWIVYAVYSTGDSFGTDQSGCIEFFTAHLEESAAQHNAEILRATESFSDDQDRYSAILHLDNGEELKIFVPWNGYFESLDAVYVEKFAIP